MRMIEHDGKELFRKYGIEVPDGAVLHDAGAPLPMVDPTVVKAQVTVGGRWRAGGVRVCRTRREARDAIGELLGATICGERVERVRVEEYVEGAAECYVSYSYDTVTRGPVLAFSARGGVDVADATVHPIDPSVGCTDAVITRALEDGGADPASRTAVAAVLHNLWRCFAGEHLLLAEINPLFLTRDGRAVAGDAKVIADDDVVRPQERRFLSLGGDIAVLASGGGASLLNIDALVAHGGRPANYTEYSGNPPADTVRDLTVRVLSQSGLCGCWVIGGTANFTDIAATMEGFIAGLRRVQPKPTYPIVIRRDGPRQREAFVMLTDVAQRERYQIYTFGSETSMEESARLMVKLAYAR